MMSARIEPSTPSGGASRAPADPNGPAGCDGPGVSDRADPLGAEHGADLHMPLRTRRRVPWHRTSNDRRVEQRFWSILCQCEIANFATLRRHLGRPRADALVLDVAQTIVGLCPDMRIVTAGRALVEFEFECSTPEAAAAEVEKLRKTFQSPLDLDGERYQLQMHFGVAAAPSGDRDDVRLTEAAESALEQARTDGKTIMLDLSRTDLAFDRLTLMRELPRAIANGEMFLQYQPKVHVRRQVIASAEALVRWQHPVRGLILPGDFISVAEQAGEIGALTIWALRQVIADQKILAADGHDMPLFINISGMLLADAGFVEETCKIISQNRDAKLGFEITETAVIRDPESAIRHLQMFADSGVTLAIDDYGAGLSSLAYLKQLPAKELKIDKMFVMQLTSSNRDPLIVRSTIDLAHALEMEVTAEGVETPSALALLSVMGCDMVQGFLISRPIAIDAFRAYLAQEGHLSATGGAHSSFVRPESFWKRA
ncbi:putative bifunctional diguanylate cyclase/phosphodiesterase [Sphingomonas sp. JC676]|uniref:putative bifunctional diguanylate cyclase/phosphodiesterase n=1 Tax=Sphingomonas sp. JC676 TaxID=2768065 RepID=UPI00223A7FE8|nr:GGDEF domain-containing phosphodiesterase [Sphingomonas sp. JC676]